MPTNAKASESPTSASQKRRPVRILITLTLTVATALVSAFLLDAPPPEDSDFLPPTSGTLEDTRTASQVFEQHPFPFGKIGGAEHREIQRMLGLAHFHVARRRLHPSLRATWNPSTALTVLQRNQEYLQTIPDTLQQPDLWISNDRGLDPHETWRRPNEGAIALQRLQFYQRYHEGNQETALRTQQEILHHIILVEDSGVHLSGYESCAIQHLNHLREAADIVPEITHPVLLKRFIAFLEANPPTPAAFQNSLRIGYANVKSHFADHPNSASPNTGLEFTFQVGFPPDRSSLETRVLHKPNLTLRSCLSLFRAAHDNASATSHEQRPSTLLPDTMRRPRPKPWVQMLSGTNLRTQQGLAKILFDLEKIHWELRARHQLAVTACALQLYQLEHGNLPSTLSELVPHYLSTVPTDPYTAGPLNYSPSKQLISSKGPARSEWDDRFGYGNSPLNAKPIALGIYPPSTPTPFPLLVEPNDPK